MTRMRLDPLVERSRSDPAAPALRVGSDRWSNAQLLKAVDGLASNLMGGGVAAGSRVACLLADAAPAVLLVHALRRIGAVLVPLNRRAASTELRRQLTDADVSHLITDREHEQAAVESARDGTRVELAESLLMAGDGGPATPLRDDVDLDEPATIIFTSGTSGRAKGAVLSHGNHVASADAWATVLRPRPGGRWLACLPLFHVAGLAIVIRAARWGAELEVQPRDHASAVAEAIDRGVTHCSLVATQLEQLLEITSDAPAAATLRGLLVGGGPTPAGLLDRARAAGYPVFTTYGMTETASGIAVGGLEGTTLSDTTAGRPLPGAIVRIAPDGEILLRGRMVFGGYVGRPEATAEALRDGWFHTGDLGSLDSVGLLRIEDRRDDLLITGGENVYPAEVEAVLRQHAGVADAAVVGRPDQRWGTVPVAFIVPIPEGEPVDAELARHCREHLARYKVPVRFYRISELPRDSLGKLQRRDLPPTDVGVSP